MCVTTSNFKYCQLSASAGCRTEGGGTSLVYSRIEDGQAGSTGTTKMVAKVAKVALRSLVLMMLITFLQENSLSAQTIVSQPTPAASGQPAATVDDEEAPPGVTSKAAADAENPIARMISIPLQNNTYFDASRGHEVSDALIIEPVIPFRLSSE